MPAQADTVRTRTQTSSDYLPKRSPTTLPFLSSDIPVSSVSASIHRSPSHIARSSRNTIDWHNQSHSRPKAAKSVCLQYGDK